MRVLITTQINDIHAVAVEAALRQRGHAVAMHYGADFPAQQHQSLRFGSNRTRRIDVRDQHGEIAFDQAEVFWSRRFMSGTTPEALHPADRAFAGREFKHVADSVLQLSAPQAFWINPPTAAAAARLKPVQLAHASEIGLSVPETLFGNDPEEIRAFVRDVGRAIYKPCLSAAWHDGERWSSVFTAPVTEADLRNDTMLRSCPGIYQRRVDKAFEVRATFFGASCLALRLDSCSQPLGEHDWRRAQHLAPPCAPIELPPQVLERTRMLMQRLSLVFGCVDFIVTPEGEWVFLEVNEMGQFLWVEFSAPQVPMLDAFVQFVESADADFCYRPSAAPLRLAALLADGRVEEQMRLAASVHTPPPSWHIHPEPPRVAQRSATPTPA